MIVTRNKLAKKISSLECKLYKLQNELQLTSFKSVKYDLLIIDIEVTQNELNHLYSKYQSQALFITI